MNLRDYLKIQEITVKEFADEIRYGQTYLYRIITGSLKPGAKLAKVIVEATRGQVTFEDLQKTHEDYAKGSFCPCCKQFHIK